MKKSTQSKPTKSKTKPCKGATKKPAKIQFVNRVARMTTGVNLKGRLTLGNMPSCLNIVQSQCRAYRRRLEDLVMEARGTITNMDHHMIDEATQGEMHGGVCRYLLRTRIETMNASDIARCSEQIVKSKQARNKAVKQLKLDVDTTKDLIIGLYSGQEATA